MRNGCSFPLPVRAAAPYTAGLPSKGLDTFGSLMTVGTFTMLEQWENVAERDQQLDVAAEMQRLALFIAGKALFNIDLSDETLTVGHSITTANKLLTEYLYAPFPPLNVPTPRNRRLQVSCRTLDQVVKGIITQRRRQNTDPGICFRCFYWHVTRRRGRG